jgi:MFS family permease
LWLFILDALTSYFVAAVVYAHLPETRPTRRPGVQTAGAGEEGFAQTLAGYRRVLRDGAFVAFILISILTVSAYVQMSTTLSLFLVNVEHQTQQFFALLVTLNAVMVVALQIPISRWAAQRPLVLLMMAGTALYLVGFGSYGVTTTAPWFVAGMVLITFGEMLVIPTSQALTALLAPPDMRARYVATERFNWIIAQSLGPVLAAAIMDRADPRWVWYGCALVCAIAIGGYLALHLAAGRRLTAQAAPAKAVGAGAPRPAAS